MKLGSAFSDNVLEDRGNRRMFTGGIHAWWSGSGRALLFTVVLFVTFFLLGIRLFDLTVVRGYEFRSLAEGNRTKELVRHAPRGIIYDRTMKPLTQNIAQYRLIKPCEKGSQQGTTGSSCTEHISEEQKNTLVKNGLPPGSFLEVDYLRRYLFPEATAHVVGYTGEITKEELADSYYQLRNYRAGDAVGRTGVELVYEDLLKGRNGRELVEVSADGKILRILGQEKELPGEPLIVTIDADLSSVITDNFPKDVKGAVVVSKPQTGEILALYSSPSFSPNSFTLGMSQKEYMALLGDPNMPMFNRAIGGVYPPGSTFKIVTSLAALTDGAITPKTIYEDTGEIRIGQFVFPNWFYKQYGGKDGSVDVVKALKRSNDIFFYKAGEALGITKLAQWSERLGVGKPLGIELPGEASGLMPGPDWKADRFSTPQDILQRNNEWYVGDTYHVSIGQGYLLTTPLQVNFWTNIVANGGKLCKPTIRKPIVSFLGQSQTECKDVGVSTEMIDVIMEGMREACSAGGTGYPFFGFGLRKTPQGALLPTDASSSGTLIPIPIACKTGTAEYGDSANKTHAWFTAFGPIPTRIAGGDGSVLDSDAITGDPQISVTVLLEESGEGSDKAAPIAKKIFEAWFMR